VAKPKISIIIPTYNRSKLLLRALESFRFSSLPGKDFEIIVSDDGSSDETGALVSSFEAEYRIKYHYQEDRGFRAAAARNAGAKLAEGDVLAFFDAGGLPGRSFAEAHLATHAQLSNTHSAVVGPVYGYVASADDMKTYMDGASLSAEQIYQGVPKETDPRYETFARVEFDLGRLPLPPLLFWTSNCSVQAEDFWKSGGFDERFQTWGMEDVDLAYRLWDRGVTFALCRQGWGIELPQPREKEADMGSLAINVDTFLRRCDPMTPAKEILSILLSVSFDLFYDLQDNYRILKEWEKQARKIDIADEVLSFRRSVPTNGSISIIGAGDTVIEPEQNATLFDFDQQFCQSRQVPDRRVRNRIGLYTGLPDKSVDSLLITSRLRGIWKCFGDPIMREASRVADNVHIAWR
jgi:validoxylamine A glucosyltransferase